MLTYDLTKTHGPMYDALYRAIRADILGGTLAPGTKLPSKRALAEHLKISKVTVETAYNQLLAEGYLYSREKVGYFVEAVTGGVIPTAQPLSPAPEPRQEDWAADLTSNLLPEKAFPFSVWAKLMREVMLDYGQELLRPVPICGATVLRQAIAGYLHDFRSMSVSPEQILVGAGADFLYNLLIQLLGHDRVYAVEDPGYSKIRRVYEAAGVTCRAVPLDGDGVIPDSLTGANVVHLSPSHHFPTGIVTPIGRRQALISWAQAAEGRYIIEDDYDSEFRLAGRPIPTMQSIDHSGRVIYLNSFTKSIAPSIRISYAVLPPELMGQFREKLGFYACTVPSFEQYTLARFLSRGYFEKHLSRMKKYYREQRDTLIAALETAAFRDSIEILEQDAGLHFLLRVSTHRSDEELKALCARAGIRVNCLSDHCLRPRESDRHCLVVAYSGFDTKKAPSLIKRLEELLSFSP
ncbi:MAG: PLP-dependent aminotransferase family protein [Ruminococcaceae bacterium]|nr:PLP-dependent aminotransferase family protein [Oscillospiraceae bacterium]